MRYFVLLLSLSITAAGFVAVNVQTWEGFSELTGQRSTSQGYPWSYGSEIDYAVVAKNVAYASIVLAATLVVNWRWTNQLPSTMMLREALIASGLIAAVLGAARLMNAFDALWIAAVGYGQLCLLILGVAVFAAALERFLRA